MNRFYNDGSFTFLPNVTETATIKQRPWELVVGRVEHRRLTLREIEAATRTRTLSLGWKGSTENGNK